jgi:O-antigen biosynthesis protein
MKILFVQQEMRQWTSARMWGYNWHLGIEEGLHANGVEVTTLLSSWMPRAREIIGNQKFDQVWINDVTHLFEPGGWDDFRLTFEDLNWLSELAPIRLGFVIETLRYREEDYAVAPFLANARNVLGKTIQYLTHVIFPDEKDEAEIRTLKAIPTLWYLPAIPARLICQEVMSPPCVSPVFFGTPYGERAKWLQLSELRGLLSQRKSKDNETDIPMLFDQLHSAIFPAVLSMVSPQTQYQQYLDGVRKIRKTAYSLYLDSWKEGCAVVSLPAFARIYTSTVYEGFALGRPVIAMKHPYNPRTNEAFIEGDDILLYPCEDPGILAEHIRHILRDPAFGYRIALNAHKKMLELHTVEKRVGQFLDWIETGNEPHYTDKGNCNMQPLSLTSTVTNTNHSLNNHPQSNNNKVFTDYLKIHFVLDMDEAQAQFSPHFGIAYLSAYLKSKIPGIGISISYLSDSNLLDDINAIQPQIIGVTSTSRRFLKMKRIAGNLKKNFNLPMLWGGVHLSIAPHELPECVDVGVFGEGEDTVLELLSNFDGRGFNNLSSIKGILYRDDSGTIVVNDKRPVISNLDDIPFPDIEILRVNWGKQRRAVIISSRGCPFKCRFCASSVFWDRTRLHSARYVVDEIRMLATRHGVKDILIYDDFFTVNKRRVAEIAEMISQSPELKGIKFECLSRLDGFDEELAADLKKMGMYKVSFGFESGSQKTLDYLKNSKLTLVQSRKATGIAKKFGLQCVGSFVIGSPYETEDEILETFRFIDELDLDNVQITVATPFPGTEMWEDGKKVGIIQGNEWRDDYFVLFAFAELDNDGITVKDFLLPKTLLTRIEKKRFIELAEYARTLQMKVNDIARIYSPERQFEKCVNLTQRLRDQGDMKGAYGVISLVIAFAELGNSGAMVKNFLSSKTFQICIERNKYTELLEYARILKMNFNDESEICSSEWQVTQCVSLAQGLRDQGDLATAYSVVSIVVAVFGSIQEPYFILAELALALGQPIIANAVYGEVINRWPRCQPAYVKRSIVAWSTGQRDVAVDLLAKSYNIDPYDKPTVLNLGLMLTAINKLDMIPNIVRTYLSKYPGDNDILKLIGGTQHRDDVLGQTKISDHCRIICQMRIKNEEKWLKEVLDSIARVAQGIVILDDGSTDRTPEICKAHPAVVDYSWQNEQTIDEVRDKNRLLQMALAQNPDWVLCMDGDEILEDSAPERIFDAIRFCPADVAVLDVEFLYMWDDMQHYRTDGIYNRLYHHRLFKLDGQVRDALSFNPTDHDGNFHCESVPENINGRAMEIDVKIKHLGYMHQVDREHKYHWYKSNDTVHAAQGYYEHLLDQPGMVLVEWHERPIPHDKGVASAGAATQATVPKQELKPDYYYANARRNIADLVPQSARRVLDVGCGQGLTGGLLRAERGIEVVGLELHAEVAEIAKSHLSRVVVGDLESMDLPFDPGFFDCIILADVLEHFVNPWDAMLKVVKYLSPDGTIIASIPNIRNIGILSKVIDGSWGYEEQGILDRTHLRFFALKDMLKLFAHAGINATIAEVVRDPLFEKVNLQQITLPGNVEYGRLLLKEITIEELNELTAQQFIFVGKRAHKPSLSNNDQKQPLVSVIVPIFDNFDYTKQCLESIFCGVEKSSFEVIIVDDASTDNSSEQIRQIKLPVQVVRHEQNRGFAISCNDGAKVANGKYLLFLNNDTIVLPGWMDALVTCLQNDPGIGLAGNRQIFPGTEKIQQAGIVCGENKMLYSIYNNQLGADHPAVNKPREFQFIAGSCIMLERKYFFSLGGFDELYLNSCEDVDLCMKVRQSGKKVFYCPQSKIYHFESRTVKSHDKTSANYKLFLSRWADKIFKDDHIYLSEDSVSTNRVDTSGKQQRVALIAPPRYFKKSIVSGYSGYSKNLGLGYIAAVLRAGDIPVSIIDAFALGIGTFVPVNLPNGRVYRCGLQYDDIAKQIPPDVTLIGISVPFTNAARITFELASYLKMRFPMARIVLGGIHPSTFPEESLNNQGVDYVICGEGESSMLYLAQRRDPGSIPGLYWRDNLGNIQKPAKPAREENLDTVPFPAWDLLPMELYFSISPRGNRTHRSLALITSRGCPFSCKFCSVHPVSGRNWRARSPENVLAEIRLAFEQYQINHIEIEDDNFTLDKQRALTILRGLKSISPAITWAAHNGVRVDTLDEELLGEIKRSGCIQLNLAIEHGSPSVLKAMNKQLSLEKVKQVVEECGRIKINSYGFCIVGHPGENKETFHESFLYFQNLKKRGLTKVIPFVVNAYPGTELYREARINGWLDPTTDQQLFFLEDEFVSVTTSDFDIFTVKMRKKAMEALNSNPDIDPERALSFGDDMSVSILKKRSEIDEARAAMLHRGINVLDESHQQEFPGKGYIADIGDVVKSWDVLKTLNFIDSHLNRNAPVLDIGAYCSEIPCAFYQLGFSNLFGIDLNPDVVKMPYCESIHYSVGNFMQTSFQDASFSAVTAVSVIEHGFNGGQLLSELGRILKPGGYFIASVDYWKEKVVTDGLTPFNMDWKIFSKEELLIFFDEAAQYGLRPVGNMDFETEEKPVSYYNRDYTFAWFVLQKKGKRQIDSTAVLSARFPAARLQ